MFCSNTFCGRQQLVEDDVSSDLKILVTGPKSTGKTGNSMDEYSPFICKIYKSKEVDQSHSHKSKYIDHYLNVF